MPVHQGSSESHVPALSGADEVNDVEMQQILALQCQGPQALASLRRLYHLATLRASTPGMLHARVELESRLEAEESEFCSWVSCMIASGIPVKSVQTLLDNDDTVTPQYREVFLRWVEVAVMRHSSQARAGATPSEHLTDVVPLGPSRNHQRCMGSNKGIDKGALDFAAQVDFNADPSEGSDYLHDHLESAAIGEAVDSECDRPLADLKCHPAPQSRGVLKAILSQPYSESEEVDVSAHQSACLQPVLRGDNQEVSESGRIFTAMRTNGIVSGYSLKCKWHGDDCVRDLSFGTKNPMTVRECQLRLLRWEELGKDVSGPGARAIHKSLGETRLLANFASCSGSASSGYMN